MEKKIKKINIRVSLEDYEYLKKHYILMNTIYNKRHKSFSAYIRCLLDLGLNDYY